MSPLEAHQRLMSNLPVRTHELRDEDPEMWRKGGRRTDAQGAALRAQVNALRAKKWRVRDIAKKLKVSRQTVYNYLRKR